MFPRRVLVLLRTQSMPAPKFGELGVAVIVVAEHFSAHASGLPHLLDLLVLPHIASGGNLEENIVAQVFRPFHQKNLVIILWI